MKYKSFAWILPLTVFLFVWWQGRLPLWSAHLQVDVWISWLRVSYWMEHGQSFVGMVGNEILPATLLYIFAPLWLIPQGWLSYQTYLPATLIINMLVLVVTWTLVPNKKVYLLSLLFLGPILLFRFDGMVALLLLLSFTSFNRQSYGLSGIAMGLATGMKVFPVLLLPYMLLILLVKNKWSNTAVLLGTFALTLAIPVFIYLIMGGSMPQVMSALDFHSDKLISIESIPGSFITAASLLTTSAPPPLLPGNGIWSVPGPSDLFNKLWMVPVGLLYLVVWSKKWMLSRLHFEVPLALVLVFLVFSKNLNPQYVWWFVILLPFVKNTKVVVALTALALLLNQLVYPVFYTTLIDDFYRGNQSYWVYYALLLRNCLILLVTSLSLYGLITTKKGQESHE